MPGTHPKRKKPTSYSNEDLEAALLAVENGKSIFSAHKQIGIPYTIPRYGAK